MMRQGITLNPSKVNQELSSFGLEIIPKKLQKLVFVSSSLIVHNTSVNSVYSISTFFVFRELMNPSGFHSTGKAFKMAAIPEKILEFCNF